MEGIPMRLATYLFPLVLGMLLALPHGALAQGASNPIVEENRKPGATDWQLTRARVDSGGFRSPWIEGYCSKQSVKAGEMIDIMVSTNPPVRFEIEVFRMGYYGGKGARLMTALGPFDGVTQPDPEKGEKDLHECRWTASASLTIPEDWLSGVYLGRLTTLPGSEELPYWQSYVIFIVTADRPRYSLPCSTIRGRRITLAEQVLITRLEGGAWADVSLIAPTASKPRHSVSRR